MKFFILKIFFFLLIFISIFGTVIVLINRKIENGNYFSIEANASNIIIGHSHPECAFNDSLIADFKNFAQSGETYYYSYIKLKKIIENNGQVKVVFIEFTNNQVNKDFDNWIWEDKYLSFRYPKYSSFMSFPDWMVLFSHNPDAVLKSISVSLKNNYSFLSESKKNYIEESGWGGYLYLERFKTDSLLISMAKNGDMREREYKKDIASINIRYLEKIIEYCKEKRIDVYLVRSPLHPQYIGFQNENDYKNILKSKFNGIEFLDFKNFPISNNQFADLEHLNFKGARVFSSFFNQLIKDGLLKNSDKQRVINNLIDVSIKRMQDSANYKIVQQ